MRTFFARLVSVAVIGITLSPFMAQAISPSYDPYADVVYAYSTTGVSSPNAALGAPDGTTSQGLGVNKFITLDMGNGEEGTGSLRVYFGQFLVSSQIQVEFIDRNFGIIKSQTASEKVNSAASTQDFPFSFGESGRAYRYVRITNLAEAGFGIDALEASAYIGSTDTVDTDGDGITDRTENTNGTDPQTPNTTPNPNPNPSPSPSCDRDIWTCSEFSSCSQGGQEYRDCTVSYDCPGVATAAPATNRSCTSLPPFTPSQPAPSPAPVPGQPRPAPGGTTSGRDTTAPEISSVHASTFSSNSELIEWKSNEPSNSQVEYGPENGPTTLSPLDPNMVDNHSVILTGLEPGVTYVFRVFSRDAAGNTGNSPESRFSIASGAVNDVITNVQSWLTCSQWNMALLILLLLSLLSNLIQHSHVRELSRNSRKRNGRE